MPRDGALLLLGLTCTALGLVGWRITRDRQQRPATHHLPAALFEGPATVVPHPLTVLSRITVEPVVDDRTALDILERVVVAGARVVILVEAIHRCTPLVRTRLWEILRFAHSRHQAAVRIVVSYDPESLVAEWTAGQEDPDAGWSTVDRMALLSIPVPEVQPARSRRPAAGGSSRADLGVTRDQLRTRAARAGMSARQTRKLMATWRFYLQFAPDDVADGAGRAGVLAEMVVRWPALRSRLVDLVDGRHGLCWLADAAHDETLWDEALHRVDLNGAAYRKCRNDLRALLRSPEAQDLARVVDWGVFG
jgi:hypothetical protein